MAETLELGSQTDLYCWLVEEHNLEAILQLSLTLSIQPNEVASRINGAGTTEVWTANDELERFAKAARLLPHVKRLTLQKPYRNATVQEEQGLEAANCELYESILLRLHIFWPGLTHLDVHTDTHSINFLKNLDKLQHLRFTGFSTSSSMETVAAFDRLRHLQSIHISTDPSTHPLTQENPSLPSSSPSLTRQVLRSLRRISSLVVCESLDAHAPVPRLITARWLRDLQALDCAALQHLELRLQPHHAQPYSHMPPFSDGDGEDDDSALPALCALLSATRTTTLILDLPVWQRASSLSQLVEALPRALRHLELGRLPPADGGVGLDAVLLDALESRRREGTLPELGRVVVARREGVALGAGVDEGVVDHDGGVADAMASLDGMGVLVTFV